MDANEKRQITFASYDLSAFIRVHPRSKKERAAMNPGKCEAGTELLFKDETYRIIHAAMNVSNELGSGFLEQVYQEAMRIELDDCAVPNEPQKRIAIHYKGRRLEKEYMADFFCFNNIVVELKAIKKISEIEEAQLLNYLKATKSPLGILINFGNPRLEWKRYANTRTANGRR
jgi:GxxExxY protein